MNTNQIINNINYQAINEWLIKAGYLTKALENENDMINIGRISLITGREYLVKLLRGKETFSLLFHSGNECRYVHLMDIGQDINDLSFGTEHYLDTENRIYPVVSKIARLNQWLTDTLTLINQWRTSDNLVLQPKQTIHNIELPSKGITMTMTLEKGFIVSTRHNKLSPNKALATITHDQRVNQWFDGRMLEQFLFGWLDCKIDTTISTRIKEVETETETDNPTSLLIKAISTSF